MAIDFCKVVTFMALCKCGKVEEVTAYQDYRWRLKDTPSRYFKRRGWTDYSGETLCPKCTDKYRKVERLPPARTRGRDE